MKTKIKIQSISAWSIGIALILTVVFVVILHYGKNEVKRFEDATDQYIVCENAARQLQDGSDYLTEQVRLYAMTGERNYLDQYFEEADVTKRREQALESLKKYFDKTEAFQSLQQAMEDSKELMLTEYHSLKLVATVMGEKDIPAELEQLDLPEEEKQLSQKEKLEKDSDSQYSVPFYRPVCDEARTGCSDGPRNRFQWESIAHDGGCPGCVCLSNAQLPSG